MQTAINSPDNNEGYFFLKGKINGNIYSSVSELEGTVNGDIKSPKVHISGTGDIEGTIKQKTLSIDEGAKLKIKTETSK